MKHFLELIAFVQFDWKHIHFNLRENKYVTEKRNIFHQLLANFRLKINLIKNITYCKN
jgi:hypothetical protein